MAQQFKDITKLQWLIILTVLFAGGFALFWFMVYSPRVEANRKLEETWSAKETQLEEMQRTIENTAELEKQIDDLKRRIRFFEGAIPTEQYIPTLLFQFEQLTMATGMEFKSIMFESGRRDPGGGFLPSEPGAGEVEAGGATAADYIQDYERMPFLVELEGSYNDFILFLRELAVFPKMVLVDHINITEVQASRPTGADARGRRRQPGVEPGELKLDEAWLRVTIALEFYKKKRDEG